jgi:hypothetical protein
MRICACRYPQAGMRTCEREMRLNMRSGFLGRLRQAAAGFRSNLSLAFSTLGRTQLIVAEFVDCGELYYKVQRTAFAALACLNLANAQKH